MTSFKEGTQKKNVLFAKTIMLAQIFLFLAFPGQAFSYAQYYTHPDLTKNIAKIYNLKFAGLKTVAQISQSETKLMAQGSIDEDELPRPFNHFFDPTRNKAWSADNFGEIGQQNAQKVFYSLAPIPPVTALEWAQNQEAQTAYENFGGNQTWQWAIYEYINGNKDNAFKALGHILHLYEDMNVPDHTRDDTHVHTAGDPGSPYESFVKDYTNSTPLDFTTAQNFSLRNIPRWNSLEQAFTDTAKYTNETYFSEDTIFSSYFSKPSVKNLKTQIKRREKNIVEIYLANSANVPLLRVIDGDMGSKNVRLTTNDPIVLKAYFNDLGQRAAMGGVGIVDLFFKQVEYYKNNPGKIKEIEPPNIKNKKQSNNLTKAFLKTVTAIEYVPAIVNNVFTIAKNAVANVFTNVGIIGVEKATAKTEPAAQIKPVAQIKTDQGSTILSAQLAAINTVINLKNKIALAKVPAKTMEPKQETKLETKVEIKTVPPTQPSQLVPIAQLPQPAPAAPVIIAPISSPAQPQTTTSEPISYGTSWTSYANVPVNEPALAEPPKVEEIIEDAISGHTEEPQKETAEEVTEEPVEIPKEIPETPQTQSAALLIAATALPNAGDILIEWKIDSATENVDSTTTVFYNLQTSLNNGSAWENFKTEFAGSASGNIVRVPTNENDSYKFRVRLVAQSANETETDAQNIWFETSEQAQVTQKAQTNIIINEIAPGWIELYNRTGVLEDLSGWKMSFYKDSGELDKELSLRGSVRPYSYTIFSSADMNINWTENYVLENFASASKIIAIYNNSGEMVDYVDLRMFNENNESNESAQNSDLQNSEAKTFMRVRILVSGASIFNWQMDLPTLGRSNKTPVLVQGDIFGEKFLSESEGPYLLGKINVKEGGMFYIGQGTVAKFLNGASLSVSKNAKAIIYGSKTQPIVITAQNDNDFGGIYNPDDSTPNAQIQTPQSGDWGGLLFQEGASSESVIENAIIRYGGGNSNFSYMPASVESKADITINNVVIEKTPVAVSLENNNSKIYNNTFHINKRLGIFINGGEPQIFSNVIDGAGIEGIAVRQNAKPIVEQNKISDFYWPITVQNAGGQYGENIFANNEWNAIKIWDTIFVDMNLYGNTYVHLYGDTIIPAGTVVNMFGNIKIGAKNGTVLKVFGTLNADGADGRVLFTSMYDAERIPGLEKSPVFGADFNYNFWKGIEIKDGGVGKFNLTSIYFATNGSGVGESLKIAGNSVVEFINSIIARVLTSNTVVSIYNSTGLFENCSIKGGKYGIMAVLDSKLDIKDCVFDKPIDNAILYQ